MLIKLLKSIFGTRNERLLKQMSKTVAEINALESVFQKLSDEALRAKTTEFRERLKSSESLDELLPEAFAAVREASVRTLKMRHFDVQLIGGIVLHQNKIAEMRTGEGKTLVATLSAYLNALAGKGVHIVTVNEYLAQRDADWMRPIYEFLDLTVGVILNRQGPAEKRENYAADVTYGTNNEFGFDYLRDNMAFSASDKVQRTPHYAIVDEVDSILIDEARTPLIISGPSDESSELYVQIDKLVPRLKRQETEEGQGDYSIDEKTRQAFLTETGHQRAEELLVETGLLKAGESLYGVNNIALVHHINAALRAHALYHRDVEYIVKEDEVVIVDEHTGRLMVGRRWSDGLHQAVEAKENVKVQTENQTLATITFQNYFRLYEKLAGMTGTADTEAYEFQQIYGLEVVVIPTNKPMIRHDMADKIYLTKDEKFSAIIEDIKSCQEKDQPTLVGTISIEVSEYLSKRLKELSIRHQVLNAKFHEQEAKIVAQAGRPGTVTIATNMAGRGTDIVLGGNLEAEMAELSDPTEEAMTNLKGEWQKRHDRVIKAGGLHIIGTERHESRRIDNQLRGRSGRQGDPGASRFYLSLQDDLMRIFASDRVASMMQRLGMGRGEAIEHRLVTRAIENAQRKVEGRNFDIRKQLLEFDDVANDQRKVIYYQRSELMAAESIAETITNIRGDVINAVIDEYIPPQSLEDQWDILGLERKLEKDFSVKLPLEKWLEKEASLHEENLRERILEVVTNEFQGKEALMGSENMRHLEKTVMLQQLDMHWKEHLAAMDYLREGIHLRGYAQKSPKQEYKREAFEMFEDMLSRLKHDVISILSTVHVQTEEEVAAAERQRREAAASQAMQFLHTQASDLRLVSEEEALQEAMPAQSAVETYVRGKPKVGRNDPCPCGSGKKFKQCHGRL